MNQIEIEESIGENINFDKTDIFDTEENSINIKFNINYGYDFSIKYNKNEFNEANFKLALNLEYRFKMFGNFNGALFSDIGNIWNIFDDTNESSRSFDGFKDLDVLAIGSGFGLRYNLGYFVFRLDTGFKTYNPVLENKDRWFSDFNFKNAVFNIGLNYPF